MISALLGVAATAILVGVWPFKRSMPGSVSGNQAAVDQRDWIYGDGAAPADGKATAQGQTADEIVRDAQERARRILAEAGAAGARLDAEAARVSSLLMGERAKLAAFLKELLEEVEGSAALRPQVVHLDEARERKQSSGATD